MTPPTMMNHQHQWHRLIYLHPLLSHATRCAIHTTTAAAIITPDLTKFITEPLITRRRQYNKAGLYALQEAIAAHVSHAIHHMETDTYNVIRSIVTLIILHACLDPLEPHEVPYAVPHDPHQPAILHYLLDLTQPLRQLMDLRTRRLHLDITAATATHLDPWHCYL